MTEEERKQFETLVQGLESAEACDEAFWILRRHWDGLNATEPPQYAVGDLVEFDDDSGQTYYGTVTSVTKKSVTADASIVEEGRSFGNTTPFNVAKSRVKRRLRLEDSDEKSNV